MADFQDMLYLPSGTIFSCYQQEHFIGLFQKGLSVYDDDRPVDFLVKNLLPQNCRGYPCVDENEICWGRDEYASGFTFYVYTEIDLEILKDAINYSSTKLS